MIADSVGVGVTYALGSHSFLKKRHEQSGQLQSKKLLLSPHRPSSLIVPFLWYPLVCVCPRHASEDPSSTPLANVCISLLCSLASWRTAASENEPDIQGRILPLNPGVFDPVGVVPNAFGLDDDPPFARREPEVWRVLVDAAGEEPLDLPFLRFVEVRDFPFIEPLAISPFQFAFVDLHNCTRI